jgi:hypothetical protein
MVSAVDPLGSNLGSLGRLPLLMQNLSGELTKHRATCFGLQFITRLCVVTDNLMCVHYVSFM